MEHHPDDEWPSRYTAEEVIEDMLAHANAWVGGALGVCDQRDEELAYTYLRERGWVGAKGGLTREGVAQAKRAQRERDEEA